jgi:protein TonB
MLAYAASRGRDLADRRPHPNTMLLIIGAHVAALAALMSAKMDLPNHFKSEPPIVVDTIRDPPPPSNASTQKPIVQQQIREATNQPPENLKLPPIVDLSPMQGKTLWSGSEGAGVTVTPRIQNTVATPVRTGPRLLTPQSEMKPPYPATKLLNEEEGAVTVRVTIDEQGRVIAVDPVGRVDPAFLDAARRHLLAHWRFKPASENGHAVISNTVVTLHFELDS